MPHVLVIDDESDSAETMAMLIASEGFTVATAGSLRDARRQMALQVPDLVLLDLMLPDGNGLELLEDTRSMMHTEVVLVTGHASWNFHPCVRRRRRSLAKPVSMQPLQNVLACAAPCPLRNGSRLESKLETEGHCACWPAHRHAAGVRADHAGGLTTVTVFVTVESAPARSCCPHGARPEPPPQPAVSRGELRRDLAPVIESEIFGHEKVSFTAPTASTRASRARQRRHALFDEITGCRSTCREACAAETGHLHARGSTTVADRLALVAATTATRCSREDRPLRADRSRLNVFRSDVALRERPKNSALAQHFSSNSKREGQRKQSPVALQRLAGYRWPGHVASCATLCRA